MDLQEDGWIGVDSPTGWESFSISIRADLVNGEPRAIGVRVEPREGEALRDVVLTLNRLRTLPLKAWAAPAYHFANLRPGSVASLAEALDEATEKGRALPTPSGRRVTTVERVAAFYAEGGRLGQAPRAYVCEAANISPRSADRYISEARKAGLLPPYNERKGRS